MRTFTIFLLFAFTLCACAAEPVVSTPKSEPLAMTADPLIDPPVTENPHGAPILPGGPGKTPDPIKVEDPIDPIVTPMTLDPLEPVEPAPGDGNKVRAAAFIDSVQLLILESYPVQINLELNGSLPTPCHKLRVAVDPPDKENRIYVDVYSVVDADKICIQVIDPFATTIKLGSFPAGHYSVYVNDELVGEFYS